MVLFVIVLENNTLISFLFDIILCLVFYIVTFRKNLKNSTDFFQNVSIISFRTHMASLAKWLSVRLRTKWW